METVKNFAHVIGYEDIMKELLRIRDVLWDKEKYSRRGVTMPHGILLYGDHGLGKTLMANCFIKNAIARYMQSVKKARIVK